MPPNSTGHFRFYSVEAYAQDSWKLRNNLTLEYGLRFAYLPNNFERNRPGVLFDADSYNHREDLLIGGDPTRPNGLRLASRGEIPIGITKNAPPRWAPRLNLAWNINGNGNTALRGGAGLDRVQGNSQYFSIQQPPNSYSASINAFTGSGLGRIIGGEQL
jgi:hypothetical protein